MEAIRCEINKRNKIAKVLVFNTIFVAMKEFKGTQGEWEIRSEYGSVGVSYEGDRFYYSEICKIDYLIHGSKELANAKLIAAAPELLAACQEFVRKCDEGKTKSTKSYQQMKAAIEKAL